MHPVRSFIAFVVYLVLADLCPAVADDRGSADVDLTFEQSVETHSRRVNLQSICRAGHEVRGCIDFPKETLECSCALRRGVWMINASATIGAVIHLSDSFTGSKVLMHEQMHLADLETSLEAHLRTITSRQYESEKACRTYARILSRSPHIRIFMNNVRKMSNRKHGCARKGSY